MINLHIPDIYEGMFQPWRYRVYYGGRGGGKSENICRAYLIKGSIKKRRVLCCRELQKSIKDSVHKLFCDIIEKNHLQDFYTVTNTSIRGKNGTEFIFLGLKHNAKEIKSIANIDDCFVEEGENVSNASWELLIPTIRNEGSSITIAFNTKNTTDPTYKRFVAKASPDTLVVKVSWRDNPFFPEVLNNERIKLKLEDEEAYQHVWEGAPDTRRSGAIYAKQLTTAREAGRITSVPYDPISEVFTAWDLGFGDGTAIWWLQFVGRELRWLEYYENYGQQLDHYAKVIKDKDYNYFDSGHFLPHDGAHGNIRGESVSKQLRDMGIRNTVLTRETDINPGIELVRQTIKFSVFDEVRCDDGIMALDNYSYEFDKERNTFKKTPKHDEHSHGADAARYAVRAAKLIKGRIGKADPPSFQIQQFSPSYMGA